MKYLATLSKSFLLFVFLAPPSFAATFTVDSTTDAVDANIGDGSCATAANECTLRAAIQEANSDAVADIINVPAGLFELTLAGIGENAAATGDLDILQPVSVIGAGKGETKIDGQGMDRVFHTTGNIDVTLQDLTVQNGSVPLDFGGGIYTQTIGTASLTLTNVHFKGNVAQDGGAVVHVGPLTITGSMFSLNDATDANGGAILHAGVGKLSISSSNFSNNRAGDSNVGVGGAVYSQANSDTVISDTIFLSNTSESLGGCLVLANNANTVEVKDSQFLDCRTGVTNDGGGGPNGQGGGAYIAATDLTLTNNTFQWNTSTNIAGGAYLAVANTISIDGNNFNMNGTGTIGGGLVLTAASSSITIINTNFQSNSTFDTSAIGSGGGLYAVAPGNLTLTNVLFDKNTANTAAAAYINASQTFTGDAVTFSNNYADGGVVGGLFLIGIGTNSASMNNFVFDGNTSTVTAGGLYVTNLDTLTIENTTISNNIASGLSGTAGGAYLVNIMNGTTMNNTTFSSNWAAAGGGGFITTSVATINNSTFAYNGATIAGGDSIYNTGPATTVSNSILAYAEGGMNCFGTFVSGDYNIDDDGSCGFAMSSDSASDPFLDPLADNGGPVKTHALMSGSPAIDSANNATCESKDARGTDRPRGWRP